MPPVLGLLVAPGTADRLAGLVVMLGRRCDPRAIDLSTPAPDAVLASSPHAPGVARSVGGPVPVAVWVQDGAELALLDRWPAPPDVVLTPSALVADASGERAVTVPAGGIDAAAFLPTAPFVRARWRRRGVLPPDLTIAAGVPGGPTVDGSELGTALAVCAAAAVSEPWLVPALAVGTPVVTTPAAASALGAAGTGAVLVAPADEAFALAREVGADEVQAAALSRGARAFVEERLDLGPVAAELAARLGLGAGAGPLDVVTTALVELGTPAASVPTRRAADAVAGLLGPPLAIGEDGAR